MLSKLWFIIIRSNSIVYSVVSLFLVENVIGLWINKMAGIMLE